MKKIFLSAILALSLGASDTIVLKRGWNLISSPYSDKNVSLSIFGNKVTSKWSFINDKWINPSYLAPGVGTWLFTNTPLSVNIDKNNQIQNSKALSMNEIFLSAKDNSWNLLGAIEPIGFSEIRSLGAKKFWYFDENDGNWKQEITVQKAKGFWIFKDSSLISNLTDLSNSDHFKKSIDAILLGSNAGGTGAKNSSSASEKTASMISTLSSNMQSTRDVTAKVKMSSSGIVSRDMTFDTLKTNLLQALSNIPEPYKSTYTNRINSATTITELQAIQSELSNMQSNSTGESQYSSTPNTQNNSLIPQDQLALIEPISGYLDEKSKTWFMALKSGSTPIDFNLKKFEMAIKNAYVLKISDEMKDENSSHYIPGRFENGVMIIQEVQDGQRIEIRNLFFDKNGKQITYNINDPKNLIWFDENGENVAPLKEFMGEKGPDFSTLKTQSIVSFLDDYKNQSGSVSIKELKSELFNVPINQNDLPEKLLFSGDGELKLQNTQTWKMKNMKLYIYTIQAANTLKHIEGTFELDELIDGKKIKGLVNFNENGCKEAEISIDGNYTGKIFEEDGVLYLKNVNGEKSRLN